MLRRNAIGQPDAILSYKEDGAFGGHRTGVDDQDDCIAAPGSYSLRRLDVRRKVHVVAAHLAQSLLHDRIKETRNGAVVKRSRRSLRRQSKLHFNRMALPRADAGQVRRKLETLLVILL